jgi:hypothetical protein
MKSKSEAEAFKMIPDGHFDLRNAAISCYPALRLSFPCKKKWRAQQSAAADPVKDMGVHMYTQ